MECYPLKNMRTSTKYGALLGFAGTVLMMVLVIEFPKDPYVELLTRWWLMPGWAIRFFFFDGWNLRSYRENMLHGFPIALLLNTGIGGILGRLLAFLLKRWRG